MNQASGPHVSERRASPRVRTIHAAKIVYGDYRYVIDCVVRDISAEGARVKVPHVAEVPESFHFYDAKSQRITPAEVAWRSEREIGVHFVGDSVDTQQSRDPRLARFKYL